MRSSNSSNSSSSGIGFAGLLQIVFIVLKLIGVINWTWFWVLSPTIISIVGAILLIIVGIILSGV